VNGDENERQRDESGWKMDEHEWKWMNVREHGENRVKTEGNQNRVQQRTEGCAPRWISRKGME
jgi:hypothetical protein